MYTLVKPLIQLFKNQNEKRSTTTHILVSIP